MCLESLSWQGDGVWSPPHWKENLETMTPIPPGHCGSPSPAMQALLPRVSVLPSRAQRPLCSTDILVRTSLYIDLRSVPVFSCQSLILILVTESK